MQSIRKLAWCANTQKITLDWPEIVRSKLSDGLQWLSSGEMLGNVKPYTAIKGVGLYQISYTYSREEYRVWVSIHSTEILHVVHVLHKKSRRGSELPKKDRDVIEKRTKKLRHLPDKRSRLK